MRWSTSTLMFGLVLTTCLSAGRSADAALFVTLRDSGQLWELAPGSGAHVAGTLAAPVGGIRWAAGIEIDPAAESPDWSVLYAAINPPLGQGNDRIVRLMPDRTTVTTVVDFGDLTTNPWDIALDANNMYVVTDTQVKVFTLGGAPVTSFDHHLAGAAGTGVGDKKPFGIAVDAVTGRIIVSGRDTDLDESPMIRVFDIAGNELATINGNSSLFGNAAIALTNSGFTSTGGTAYLYTLEVASGDLLRVYDSSFNLIRSIHVRTVAGWPTADGDNIPGMDIDPATGDIYLVYMDHVAGAENFGTRLTFSETLGNNFVFDPGQGLIDVTIGTFALPEPGALATLVGGLVFCCRRGAAGPSA